MDDVQGDRAPTPENLALVGVFKALEHLDGDEDRVGDREGNALFPASLQHAAQVAAVDILHRHVVEVVDLSKVQDLDNVGVRQKTGNFCLFHQQLHEFLVLGQCGRDTLDREEAVEPPDTVQPGLENLGHGPRRDALENQVFAEGLLGRCFQERCSGSEDKQTHGGVSHIQPPARFGKNGA